MTQVQEIFEKFNIHHVPIVRDGRILGIVSKSDSLYFLKGFTKNADDKFVNTARMRAYRAEDIMTKGLAKLEPNDRINVALEIFKTNRFHAVPVVENGILVGMLTTFDIIRALAEEPVTTDKIIEANRLMH